MPTRTTGAARWFAETTLAGPTRINQSSLLVQNSSTQIVNNSPDRVGLVIVNGGAFDIFITPVAVGAPNAGIRLSANGGNVTMNIRDDFEVCAQAWIGISAGGAVLTYFMETLADVLLPVEQA